MEEGTTFKMLADKPRGKRPLGRPRRRRDDSFRMDFKERDVNTMN